MPEQKRKESAKEKLTCGAVESSAVERAELVIASGPEDSQAEVSHIRSSQVSRSAFAKDQKFDTQDEADKLAKIVGDPHAEEKHWYPAAEAAGGKDLSGAPSMTKIIMFRAAAVVGVVFSFLSILACYTSSIYLSSHFGQFTLGLNNNLFLNDLVGLDYVGFFVSGAACLMFWSSFFGFYKRTFRYLTIALFVGIMVHSVNFHLMIGVPASAAFAIAYLPVLFLVEWIGGACRDALPMQIGSKKLASALLPAVAFPAIAMGLSLLYIFSPLNPPGNSVYEDGTVTSFGINAVLVILCSFIPGFVLARSTNSKSPVGSATLAMLLQTPLVVGMLLTIGACLFLGWLAGTSFAAHPSMAFLNGMGSGNWSNFGGPKGLAILAGALFAGLSAAAGGSIGAWCNNHFRDKTDVKPIEMG
ncbi:MAG: hypothetical protein DKT66_23730 [Candidatus Melainabacteria bacterium]|nr:MAG: hypothetical protein DKT66_23730 [Candidatus Melainabacteria bacterium]